MNLTFSSASGSNSSLQHRPGDKWAFDEDVTACFEDMLARSIPDYQGMRDVVTLLAGDYRQKGTDIVDLGSSRGGALAPLIDRYGAANRFIGVECSQPMVEAFVDRFEHYIDAGTVTLYQQDLRHAYPPVRASVTLSVLTLQFIPIEYRQGILRDVYHTTLPGGAFILVEKVLGATSELDQRFVGEYLDLKQRNGYGPEEILRKRASLEGVLVPVTSKWNEDLLKAAGFSQIDCFWRYLNFAGWIAVKEHNG